MKTTKSILLMVLLCYIALFAVLCMPMREQTRQEIMHEYQKHKEAFEYVKEYFIANDISQIRKESEKITLLSDKFVPLEDIDDESLIRYVQLFMNDLNYSAIYNPSTSKQNIMQLMFLKDTNKTYYYKEIVYCEDNQPPVCTSSVFYNVEQVDNYWFYCEEDTDEDLF